MERKSQKNQKAGASPTLGGAVRRFFTAAASIAVVLMLAVSILAADVLPVNWHTGGRDVEINLSEFSTILDVSYQPHQGNGEDGPPASPGQFFKSYAFAEEGRDAALRWHEIATEMLTMELRWNMAGVMRNPGRLVLSSAPAAENTARTIGELAGGYGHIRYAVYTITHIAPNPAPVRRHHITYVCDGAYVNIGAGNEWSKEGYVWHPADANGPYGTDMEARWARVTLSTERQPLFVRAKGNTADPDNITLPSLRPVRVTVPAMSRVPNVNIHLSRGLLSTRGGMEISNDGRTWARMTGSSLPLGVVTDLPASAGSGSVPVDLNDMRDVYIRRLANRGRPPSDTLEIRIKIRDAGPVLAEHFVPASGQTLLVGNAVVMEAYTQGRWRRVRQIAARDIPFDGLRVRRAGAHDRMPGPEAILTLDSHGGAFSVG